MAVNARPRRDSSLVGQVSEPKTSADGPSRSRAQSCIALDGVDLLFRSGQREVQALLDIDLPGGGGEFIALLGPTGCGKSSLLRLISDLHFPDVGHDRKCAAGGSAARRVNAFGFVFQEPALLSWRTAIGNVRLPLEVVGYPPEKRNARCEGLLNSVGLLKFKDAYPHELSGGMKQRVAIVRALAWNPSILLMDEPFSALDELTRGQLQDDLLQLWSRERKTVVFVTHNISEAIYLADRVVVMSPHPGRIKTVLSPGLPRPRSAEMLETGEFLRWTRNAREALKS